MQMCPCFCLFAAEHIYQDKVYCYQFSIDCTSVPSCRCPIYSVLYSPVFLVMSHVNVPLYKKQNLEKPFKPRHRAIQLEFIFNIFYHFSSVPV